jgi:hypothetical protein
MSSRVSCEMPCVSAPAFTMASMPCFNCGADIPVPEDGGAGAQSQSAPQEENSGSGSGSEGQQQ